MAINQVSRSNVTVWKSQLAPSRSGLIKATQRRRGWRCRRPAPISRAHMPGEQHDQRADERGEQPKRPRRDTEDAGVEPREHRRDRRVVHVSRARVLAADDVVHLVALEAVHAIGGEMDREFQRRDREQRRGRTTPPAAQGREAHHRRQDASCAALHPARTGCHLVSAGRRRLQAAPMGTFGSSASAVSSRSCGSSTSLSLPAKYASYAPRSK